MGQGRLAQVRDQRGYLVRITTRQALNRLRTLKRRKEAYVGPWLPEPLLTAPDVAEDVELSENLSLALMFILETLSPTERAVFVLREVFDIGYDDIAAAIGKSPAAARQIAYRARRHVDARRPRTPVSREPFCRIPRNVLLTCYWLVAGGRGGSGEGSSAGDGGRGGVAFGGAGGVWAG